MSFDRIAVSPVQMGGAPCIRSLRIPVAAVEVRIPAHADHRFQSKPITFWPSLELRIECDLKVLSAAG
jgi:hypothetical protein